MSDRRTIKLGTTLLALIDQHEAVIVRQAAEIERLRDALASYRHCPHAIPACYCTTKAREALGESPAPLGVCSRCGAELNNVAPGCSVVRGGALVCAVCLNPGEEVARSRGI